MCLFVAATLIHFQNLKLIVLIYLINIIFIHLNKFKYLILYFNFFLIQIDLTNNRACERGVSRVDHQSLWWRVP